MYRTTYTRCRNFPSVALRSVLPAHRTPEPLAPGHLLRDVSTASCWLHRTSFHLTGTDVRNEMIIHQYTVRTVCSVAN
eukprot:1416824-Pleurochrysis_carterae.AAC.3